jgi:hypothetical protein
LGPSDRAITYVPMAELLACDWILARAPSRSQPCFDDLKSVEEVRQLASRETSVEMRMADH